MNPTVRCLLLCCALALLALTAAAGRVVSVRFESCRSCRLQQLPRVKRFLEETVAEFPAASVRWVQGRDPEALFLDEFDAVVDRRPIASLSPRQIEALLAAHGIDRNTAAYTPRSSPRTADPTPSCVAWRRTRGCDPEGEREPSGDRGCSEVVPSGLGGYCECAEEPRNVGVECDMPAFRCDELCTQARDHVQGTMTHGSSGDMEGEF